MVDGGWWMVYGGGVERLQHVRAAKGRVRYCLWQATRICLKYLLYIGTPQVTCLPMLSTDSLALADWQVGIG